MWSLTLVRANQKANDVNASCIEGTVKTKLECTIKQKTGYLQNSPKMVIFLGFLKLKTNLVYK